MSNKNTITTPDTTFERVDVPANRTQEHYDNIFIEVLKDLFASFTELQASQTRLISAIAERRAV